MVVMCLGTDVVVNLSPALEGEKQRKSAVKSAVKLVSSGSTVGRKEELESVVVGSSASTFTKVDSVLAAVPKKRGRPSGGGKKVQPPELDLDEVPSSLAPKEEQQSTAAPKKRGRPPGSGKKVPQSECVTQGASSATPEVPTLPIAPPPKKRGRPPGGGKKASMKDKGKGKEKVPEVPVEEGDPQMDYDMSGLIRMDDFEMKDDDFDEDGSGEVTVPTNGSSFMKGNVMQGASPSQPPPVETSVDKLAEGSVQVTMVHGDVLVVSGEDFTVSWLPPCLCLG